MSQQSQASQPTDDKPRLPGGELPERGPRRPVVAAHPRPQADRRSCTWCSVLVMFLVGRHLRDGDPARAAHARADHHGREHLQPHVHAARRGHDLPVHDPGDPGRVRQLLPAAHAGGEGRRVPEAEPAVALPLLDGRHPGDRRHDHGRRRHRLDVLRALQHDDADDRVPGAARRLHPRLLVDPHRSQLHRHDPHAARARPDLDADAAVRLGDLRDQHHPGAGDAGHRPDGPAGRHREGVRLRPVRPDPGRRPGAVPAPVLVLLAPGRLHHGAAGDGRGQRGDRRLRAQERLRLQDDRLLVAGHRLRRLLHLGPPHVRVGPVALRRRRLRRHLDVRRRVHRHQGLQLGRRRSTAAPSRSRRRSSTSAASSSSSCSAA